MHPVLLLSLIIIFGTFPSVVLIMKLTYKNSVIFTTGLIWSIILSVLIILAYGVGYTKNLNHFYWGIPLGLILILVGNIYLDKSIRKKLNKITQNIIEISTGNIDIIIEEDMLKRKDEVGELSKAVLTLINSTREAAEAAKAIGHGNYNVPIKIRSKKDVLGLAIQNMKSNLNKMKKETELQDWFKTGKAELGNKMRGDQNLSDLSQNVINYLATYLDAKVGAIYLKDDKEELFRLASGYAYKKIKGLSNTFKIGEGLAGQAVFENRPILVREVPDNYIKINSGLGASKPLNILVMPLIYDKENIGVLELGSFKEFSDTQLKFIEEVSENIAIAFLSARSRNRVKSLLDETQKQTQEMQSQQEELRVINEELQAQQEELRVANEELEEQAESLRKSEELMRKQQEKL